MFFETPGYQTPGAQTPGNSRKLLEIIGECIGFEYLYLWEGFFVVYLWETLATGRDGSKHVRELRRGGLTPPRSSSPAGGG